jgi:hypothetical protein
MESEPEWGRIVPLAASALGFGTDAVVATSQVLTARDEVRLKFNSPTPVRTYVVRMLLSSPAGEKISGEFEIFHWQAEDLWEVAQALRLL